MYGFFSADGNLYEMSRNRGRFSIELSVVDVEILERFKVVLEGIGYTVSLTSRTRNTNFKKNYCSSVLRLHSFDFRQCLKRLGYIAGNKAGMSLPAGDYSIRDYLRGYFDANGSVGFTAKGFPFICLGTPNENVANLWKEYAGKITGYYSSVKRNARDGYYNIMFNKERAQEVIKNLYTEDCICLRRKKIVAEQVLLWQRPDNMRKHVRQVWEAWEDDYVLSHSIKDSVEKLQRSYSSIVSRRGVLKKLNKVLG
jgi:hypothetical protein